MKRIVCSVLAAVLMLCMIPMQGKAAEAEIVMLENGDYMMIETVRFGMRASGTVTGNKTYTYYDSNDDAQWKAVLTGKFTYTGSGATCTSSSVSTTIYDSSWTVISKSATKSGNKAKASVKMGDKVEGTITTTVPVSLTLSCDANGNLS